MDLLELRKQNPWWENRARIEEDTKIRDYENALVKWTPRLKKYLFLDKNVVYSIRGPRQVGKTTLLKIMIRELLQQNNPLNIIYFACDLLKDNLALKDLLDTYLNWVRSQNQERIYIFLDEISAVNDWQKAIKQFIDLNGNHNVTLVLTGSHTLDIKNSTERLPGRVGEKEHVPTHKILLPMKFAEYVQMRAPELYKQVQEFKLELAEDRTKQFLELIQGNMPASANNLVRLVPELDLLLEEYLLTGGIMVAVNEYVKSQRISSQIYDLYIRQIMGDLSRINREEKTAKRILASVLKRIGSAYSWNSIRKEADIPTQPTVDQYAGILDNMFVLNIVYKIELDGTVKPASDKKVYILNPFIFHALNSWLVNPAKDPFECSKEYLLSSEEKSKLIEAVVGDHLNRAAHNLRPTDTFDPSNFVFYSKTNKGYETDFVFKTDKLRAGIEVKYQNTINSEDFRGIMKIGGGCVVSKKTFEQKDRFAIIPVSLFLLYV
ncbi:ATP-binding protein [Candidatus Woesearchaeota archaeon]|nr:ATP-binding protein [Candidatus Woesearchaeota archaeon]